MLGSNDYSWTPGKAKRKATFDAPHGSAWTDARHKPKRDGQYACLTNYGDIFVVDCIMGEWERPARFNDGEQVEWWIPLPCSREATAHQTPHIAYTPNGESSDGATHQKGTNAK